MKIAAGRADCDLHVHPLPGTVSWLDLSTRDVDGAMRFYAALFDWSYHSVETPMGPYRVARLEDRDVAGIMAGDPGAHPAWTVFVEVASLERATESAVAAGGAMLQPPMEIPGGRVAVLADPAGAMLAVIESPPDAETLTRGAPGTLHWTEVLSRDVEAAKAFYPAVFSWKATSGPTGYVTFVLDDEPVAGLMEVPPQVPAEAPSHWLVSFTVDDLDAVVNRAVEVGAVLDQPPVEIVDGRFAVLDDPGGATFAVFEPKPRS